MGKMVSKSRSIGPNLSNCTMRMTKFGLDENCHRHLVHIFQVSDLGLITALFVLYKQSL